MDQRVFHGVELGAQLAGKGRLLEQDAVQAWSGSVDGDQRLHDSLDRLLDRCAGAKTADVRSESGGALRDVLADERDEDGVLVREVLVHRADRDAGAAATIIGLHGGGGYGRLMTPIGVFARRLGLEAVLPDLPGYGLTTVPRKRFTYQTWVACVRDLAIAEHERNTRPVIAVGASMGGMLAWHAAAAGAPLAGIVATTLIDPLEPAVRAAVGRTRWAGTVGARLLSTLPSVTDPIPMPMRLVANMSAIANDPAVASLLRHDPLGGGRTVPARFLRTWLTYAPAAEPETFTLPVLLAHPAEDRWTPVELSRRFLERLAGPRRLVQLERCGHFPLEEPGLSQLETAIQEFVNQLCGTESALR